MNIVEYLINLIETLCFIVQLFFVYLMLCLTNLREFTMFPLVFGGLFVLLIQGLCGQSPAKGMVFSR